MLIANETLAANEIGDVEGDNKSIEKCEKLSKIRKLFKSQKSAKLGKKLSKYGNLPNSDVKENGPSFLTLITKKAFNRF